MRLLAVDYNSFSVAYTVFTEAGEFERNGIIKSEDFKELMTLYGDLLDEVQPTHVAIEKLYVGLNAATVSKLAAVWGAVDWESQRHGAKIFKVYPTHWKKEQLGSGKATKKDSLRAANTLLGATLKDDNIADSLHIGMCALKEIKS